MLLNDAKFLLFWVIKGKATGGKIPFLKEREQNEPMHKKHKKVCTTLNYIEEFLILASAITGCI